MILRRRFPGILLLLTGLVWLSGLAACGPDAPTVGVTPLPPVLPTVTAGGAVLMYLPTGSPVAPTPIVPPTPLSLTPAYMLTALPAQTDAVCPRPGSPAVPPAPASYGLYATAIAQYLSAGATPQALLAALREWGGVTDTAGMVTDLYDLTGDGVYEIVVTVVDPFNAEVAPLPGQLLVFGCHLGGYMLLYSSDYGPGFGVPTVLYVGDINADTNTDLVFFQERCQSSACVQAAQVMSWSAPNEGFLALNVDTIGSADGRFSIADLDDDGIMELMVQGGGISSDASVGPPRSSTTVWDWDGRNYVRAFSRLDAPLYRIHVIHDADRALQAGDPIEAERLYREALDNPRLGTWNVPNESAMLRGYALFKLVVVAALQGDGSAARGALAALEAENPPGSPAAVYSRMASAFWTRFGRAGDLHEACLAAAEEVPADPQAVMFLNSYGPANRTYQVPDLCPF